MRILGFLAFCVFFSLSFSCQNPETVLNANDPDLFTLAGQEPAQDGSYIANLILDIGQVTRIDLEGGFWGIVGTKGNYDPTNLPKDFCVNGLWVIFQAQPVTDMVSIHQWGTLVKILRIEKLSDQIISDVGIVNQSGIQGKPWLIEGTKATYQPVNLPDKYKIVGLKVKFTAKLRTDIVIAPSVWPLIEIITISVVPEPPVYFNVDEKFRLSVTCTAIEKNANIKMLFEKVISDSRCPAGAECLVAGYAQVSVRISVAGVDYGSIILDTDQSKELRSIGGYRFSLLDLEPYPVLKNIIPPQRQVGVFLVEKAPQPTPDPTPIPTEVPTPVPPVSFTLGELFKLPVTQTAIEPDAKIKLTFSEVLQDNRCPLDVQCFAAGDAVIAVKIAIEGTDYGYHKLALMAGPGVTSRQL